MPDAKTVIYNLEPYAPGVDTPDSSNEILYRSLIQLLNNLSSDGADKLCKALVRTARYVIDASGKSDSDLNIEIHKMFVDSNTDSIRLVNRCFLYKVVERVITGDHDSDYKVTNSWITNSDYTKAVFLQSLLKHDITEADSDIIYHYYHLEDYLPKIYCGMMDDTEYVEYATKYNKYLYEFYGRSPDRDQQKLDGYSERCSYGNMMSIYGERSVGVMAPFQFSINLSRSITQAESDVDEHCKDLKFIIKRLYEVNYSENGYRSTTGGGNSHYLKQFAKWDRYLRIFDLYREYKDAGEEVNKPQLDAIGKKIVKEFNVYEGSSPTDRRKEILKGYKEAQRLIELSIEGRLS